VCMHAAAVNDAPSFNVSNARVTVAEDAAPYRQPWASQISAGRGENQTMTFSTSCDDAAGELFTTAPSVDADGVLTFTVAEDAFGSSNCTVTLTEDGDGGLKSSAGLTIEVTPVNDPPSFTAGDATITVAGDSGDFNKTWARNISAGPREQGQQLGMSIDCSDSKLFTAGPSISADGVLSFTPAKNTPGSTNCTVTLAETFQGGLKATAPLSIEVTDGEEAGVHCACCGATWSTHDVSAATACRVCPAVAAFHLLTVLLMCLPLLLALLQSTTPPLSRLGSRPSP
jgi:hypothetical protein